MQLRFSLERASMSDRCPGESIVLQTQSTGLANHEGSGASAMLRSCIRFITDARLDARLDLWNGIDCLTSNWPQD